MNKPSIFITGASGLVGRALSNFLINKDYHVRGFGLGEQFFLFKDSIFSLIDEGWSIGIRSHPYHPHDLENRFAEMFGVADTLKLDNAPTFEQALASYDVVASNLTTAYYQALFAGWPTIFHEPDYHRKGGIEGIETDAMLTGLLTASDLERPVTNDPQTLGRMIRDSIDPDSMVSTFPRRFSGQLAPRFIGPDPARPDTDIADFIEQDFFAVPSNAT